MKLEKIIIIIEGSRINVVHIHHYWWEYLKQHLQMKALKTKSCFYNRLIKMSGEGESVMHAL